MRTFVAALTCSFLLFCTTSASAITLELPDLDLSSTPSDVGTWASQHHFAPVLATPPYDATYQRTFTGGVPLRHVVSFVTDAHGLKMLAFEQFNIPDTAAGLRRKIVERFGKPTADQILQDRTLRITYRYQDREPARRIFLAGPHRLTMLLMTDSYFARMKGETEETERAQQQAERDAKIAARDAWLVPLLWLVAIVVGGAALVRVLPGKARARVLDVLGGALGLLVGFIGEVAFQLLPIVMGIVLLALMILSALAVGAGAAEWGTSLWWGVFWLAGLAMVYKAHDEGSLQAAILAVVMFLIAFLGVILQQSWPLF
jgi:hypothetical protein